MSGKQQGRAPTVISRFPLAMSVLEIKQRYDAMNEIEYRSNDNIVRERTIHPYKLYITTDVSFWLFAKGQVNLVILSKLNNTIYCFAE